MIHVAVENTFENWRNAARKLLVSGIPPEDVVWAKETQTGLFDEAAADVVLQTAINVPNEFVKIGTAVACFDDPEKWPLLYRILFRLTNSNRNLLEIESDKDVRTARIMEKAVNRDVHKFHAFVRFRRVECEGDEIFCAWHEPQHFTVERAIPFFERRFGSMKFSILTPKGCAHWDKTTLTFSPAVGKNFAPPSDETEEFWLLYYRSIFNPFRLKIKTMKKEFPVRHWSTLPEAVLIPELIRSALELNQD
ncbi:MAG: TIGR03915 family putative DNA repair protein [Pyrinomonadaceae bacterium]